MIPKNLLELLNKVQANKTENQELEIKSAQKGCPSRLYDTLSSFSNQDAGGTILFGVDENSNFSEVGVYDANDLQKQVNNQCKQMEPVVRPILTVVEKDGKHFVSAEIPGLDLADRPCFYRGQGRLKGAYTRVGDSDESMTEYEIYSFESFRKKYQDDIRPIERASLDDLNVDELNAYITQLKLNKPNLSQLPVEKIYSLMSILKNQHPTLATTMMFGLYPQAFFPQLSIIATVVPGEKVGDLTPDGERFIDNERIEGTIPQQFARALSFVRRNIRVSTYINPQTGMREDRAEYSIAAIREALLNALVHRDYSVHTEGQPIQLQIFSNRIEITNPGGLYGRLTVDQLGNTQPDTRNPVLISMMEVLKITENRYSGIPTMIAETQKMGLEEPQFSDKRGSFCVTFFNKKAEVAEAVQKTGDVTEDILKFCQTPKSRQEISEFLGIATVSYTSRTYIKPLLESGRLQMTLPDNPRSSKQKFVAA